MAKNDPRRVFAVTMAITNLVGLSAWTNIDDCQDAFKMFRSSINDMKFNKKDRTFLIELLGDSLMLDWGKRLDGKQEYISYRALCDACGRDWNSI